MINFAHSRPRRQMSDKRFFKKKLKRLFVRVMIWVDDEGNRRTVLSFERAKRELDLRLWRIERVFDSFQQRKASR